MLRACLSVCVSSAYASICNKVHMSMKCGIDDKAVAHFVARQEFGPPRAPSAQNTASDERSQAGKKKREQSLEGKKRKREEKRNSATGGRKELSGLRDDSRLSSRQLADRGAE